MLELDVSRLGDAERAAFEAIRQRHGDEHIRRAVETMTVTIGVLRSDGRSDADILEELGGRGHDIRHEFDRETYIVHKALLRQMLSGQEVSYS